MDQKIICDPYLSLYRINCMMIQIALSKNVKERSERSAAPVCDNFEEYPIANAPLDKWSLCLLRFKDTQQKAEFILLFEHFAPRIKSYMMRCGAHDVQADDLAQDVMATVWLKAYLFNPAKATASTWIYTIARNKQIDAIRKENRPQSDQQAEDIKVFENDALSEYAKAQERDLLQEALSKLPETQRDIIQKAFLGELSHAEIAEKTRLPLGTIKSRIRLGLEKLRHELKAGKTR